MNGRRREEEKNAVEGEEGGRKGRKGRCIQEMCPAWIFTRALYCLSQLLSVGEGNVEKRNGRLVITLTRKERLVHKSPPKEREGG